MSESNVFLRIKGTIDEGNFEVRDKINFGSESCDLVAKIEFQMPVTKATQLTTQTHLCLLGVRTICLTEIRQIECRKQFVGTGNK